MEEDRPRDFLDDFGDEDVEEEVEEEEEVVLRGEKAPRELVVAEMAKLRRDPNQEGTKFPFAPIPDDDAITDDP